MSTEEEMLSMISNAGLNVVAEGSDSNSSSNPCRPNKRQRQDNATTTATTTTATTTTSSARFKGVVLQQNGHWGAQIYANHQRNWLGTFKSEKEAAMAYDSAAIKLRSGDSHRNYPWTNLTIREPNFQDLHTTDAILNMIKDGSYQPKFMDYMRSRSLKMDKDVGMGLNLMNATGNDGGFLCQQLFQKELTPSDVGKLNRLVIPKKYAVKYFPQVSEVSSEEDDDAGGGGVDDVQLVFFDRQMRSWKFRYCYWKSSQSFVFTRGWNRFVREKELKAKDVITFYRCEYREWFKEQQAFCMIDVGYSSRDENSGSFAERHDEYAAGKKVELQLGFVPSIECESSLLKDRKKWEKEEKLAVTGFATPPVAMPMAVLEKKGIRIFGVNIS